MTNALHHVPDVLTYMEHIQNQSVFNFCSIPQVYYNVSIYMYMLEKAMPRHMHVRVHVNV